MFTSLKNKIREETGSDLSKITSSWRSGAFLGRAPPKDEPISQSSSGGCGDSTSESISPKLESYLEERASGALSDSLLEEKLRERDAAWEKRLEQLQSSLTAAAAHGEEAAAAQAVARTAAAEAAAAEAERDAAQRQLQELRDSAAAAARAHDRLDALTEELELERREWSRERGEHRAALAEAESRARSAVDELTLVKASLPPGHPYHLFEDEGIVNEDWKESGSALAQRCRREQAVLRRQLQEARLALADVKTSWSGQMASLETQVARVSRQAGEEGAERRRAEQDNATLREELSQAHQQLAKLKQNAANSEAKVSRLGGEVRTLAAELRAVRADSAAAAERAASLESRLAEVTEENAELRREAAEGREAEARGLRAGAEREREAAALTALVAALQAECRATQRRYEKEKAEKDEALMRNAQMSQSMELRQCDLREQEEEIVEYRAKLAELEGLLAQHRENQAACMIIQEKEASLLEELEQLRSRVQELTESEIKLKNSIEELETQLSDKNKKMRNLDTRIVDMKRTLQREMAGRTEEEAEISRRYLKHVVLRFVTAREEARQLTRALAALLRLSAQEEAALQAALPPPAPSTLAGWFASFSPT